MNILVFLCCIFPVPVKNQIIAIAGYSAQKSSAAAVAELKPSKSQQILVAYTDLQIGFYSSTSPQAESIIQAVVQTRFSMDPTITPALLRLHFHDCFVMGCDALILIDGFGTEKTADPNLTVRGYELIDEIKAALEAQCPLTASCADIITVATRDSVALAGGPIYSVPTGRRDGLLSNSQLVNLPNPQMSVAQAFEFFRVKGFTLEYMVILLDAHTVGVTHCGFFQDRLSNFQGTGFPDPSLDPNLGSALLQICGSPSGQTAPIALDQSTPLAFDNRMYNGILFNRAVLQLDQELGLDGFTRPMVLKLASFNNELFGQLFATAMVKLGTVEVLVDFAGEVRQNCRFLN